MWAGSFPLDWVAAACRHKQRCHPGTLPSCAAFVLQCKAGHPFTCQAGPSADTPTMQFDRCSVSRIARHHISCLPMPLLELQMTLCNTIYDTWDQARRGGLSCPRCPLAGHCLHWLPPWLLPWPQQAHVALQLSFHHLPAQTPAPCHKPEMPG
jgi:hypothetical protein